MKPFLTGEECAEMMGIAKSTFFRAYSTNPTFPKRIMLPNAKKPLWESEEVVSWIRRYKEN